MRWKGIESQFIYNWNKFDTYIFLNRNVLNIKYTATLKSWMSYQKFRGGQMKLKQFQKCCSSTFFPMRVFD